GRAGSAPHGGGIRAGGGARQEAGGGENREQRSRSRPRLRDYGGETGTLTAGVRPAVGAGSQWRSVPDAPDAVIRRLMSATTVSALRPTKSVAPACSTSRSSTASL